MKTVFLSLGLLFLFNNPTAPVEMETTITYCHQTTDICSKNGTYQKSEPNEFIIGFGKFFKNDTLKVYLNNKLYYHGIVNTIMSTGRADLMIKYNFGAKEEKVDIKIVLDSERRNIKNKVTTAKLDLSYNQVMVSLISGDKWIFDHNNHVK